MCKMAYLTTFPRSKIYLHLIKRIFKSYNFPTSSLEYNFKFINNASLFILKPNSVITSKTVQILKFDL